MRSVAAIYVPRDLTVTICFLTAATRARACVHLLATSRCSLRRRLLMSPLFACSQIIILVLEWNGMKRNNAMEWNEMGASGDFLRKSEFGHCIGGGGGGGV